MDYTCNMKSSGKYLAQATNDGEKMNVLCIVDRNHERSVVLLDHFRNFKGFS